MAPVRPGEALDWAALEAWLRPRLAEGLPDARGPIEVLQFPNGSANLTYLIAGDGSGRWVGLETFDQPDAIWPEPTQPPADTYNATQTAIWRALDP